MNEVASNREQGDEELGAGVGDEELGAGVGDEELGAELARTRLQRLSDELDMRFRSTAVVHTTAQ